MLIAPASRIGRIRVPATAADDHAAELALRRRERKCAQRLEAGVPHLPGQLGKLRLAVQGSRKYRFLRAVDQPEQSFAAIGLPVLGAADGTQMPMNLVRRSVEVSDRVEGDCFAEFANRISNRSCGFWSARMEFEIRINDSYRAAVDESFSPAGASANGASRECSSSLSKVPRWRLGFNRNHPTAAVFWPNRGLDSVILPKIFVGS